jgi:predicted ATPase
MLTRLRVNGFKNLVDVDVRFGPFTCIAGANGVGKSNLFDAIGFLSTLADRPLLDAARAVRDETGRSSDVRNLFHRVGSSYAPEMSFEAEMIVPRLGVDDLGQQAEASSTFLRYTVGLAYRADDAAGVPGSLELRREELTYISIGEARDHLPFPHSVLWRHSAVAGRRTSPLISMEGEGSDRVIKLHQDKRPGRPLLRSASSLPRTVLSVVNAAESPTALLARNEMRSWRLLQLEPLSLRRPDDFSAPSKLGMDGAHLPATLYRLARTAQTNGARNGSADAAASVYARVANRLSELIDDVREVTIDRDEKRELLTLQVAGSDRTAHAARSLSDGTLRFLALAVLEQDPDSPALLCLEEPENGIHPERIPAMLRLLQDIVVDVREEVGQDNPLRQVIVNTHSPAVVTQVPEDSLVVAELRERLDPNTSYKSVRFRGLQGTWRQKGPDDPGVPLGRLLAYLNPAAPADTEDALGQPPLPRGLHQRRVVDRDDVRQLAFAPAVGHG